MKRNHLLCPLAALALAGCGNWSNLDLEYLNALPSREELASKLPDTTSTQSPLETSGVRQRRDGLAVGERSPFYESTRKSSRDFNAMLDALLGSLEAVRQHPPTSRQGTQRFWGPFPAAEYPGFDIQVVMDRTAEDTFSYAVQFRPKGGEWFSALTGSFKASGGVRKGEGQLALLPKDAREHGLELHGLTGLDAMVVGYVTDRRPTRVDMVFTLSPGHPSNLSQIGYTYRELKDLSGAIHFATRGNSPEASAMEVTSKWLPSGEGRADALVTEGTYAGLTQMECWDDQFNVVYSAQRWPGGVTVGPGESACASVPDL